MPINDCPHCKVRIFIQTGYPDDSVKCPDCGQYFDIVKKSIAEEVSEAYYKVKDDHYVPVIDQLYLEKEKKLNQEWDFGNVDESDRSCVDISRRVIECRDDVLIPYHGISIVRGLYEAGDGVRRLNGSEDALKGWEAYQVRRKSWYNPNQKLRAYSKYRQGDEWLTEAAEEES